MQNSSGKTVSNPDRQTQNTSYTVLLPIQNILQPMTQTRSPFCLRAQSIRKNALPLLATQIRPRTPPRRRKPRRRRPPPPPSPLPGLTPRLTRARRLSGARRLTENGPRPRWCAAASGATLARSPWPQPGPARAGGLPRLGRLRRCAAHGEVVSWWSAVRRTTAGRKQRKQRRRRGGMEGAEQRDLDGRGVGAADAGARCSSAWPRRRAYGVATVRMGGLLERRCLRP